MPKVFDEINGLTRDVDPLPQHEIARRGVRSILKRMANPKMAEDCRQLAKRELKHWRLVLMSGGKSL